MAGIAGMMWMDRRIEDMQREELLDVIAELIATVDYYQRPGMSRAMALGQVEMLKRGEGTANG